MSCTGTTDCSCGCCAGIGVETPQAIQNPPGQGAVAYRTGTYAQFKDSMLARLSSSDYPALAPVSDPLTMPPTPIAPGLGRLVTRSDGDFTIAFLDATAMMLDVLTFYQERLANEAYLRTAQARNSVLELAGLVGYQLKPGVASGVFLAFGLKTGAGPVLIPAGSQVQSVPGSGQTAQFFETSTDLNALPGLGNIPARSSVTWAPQVGDTGVYLSGTATQLNPGDLVLIVGDERKFGDPVNFPTSNQWAVRQVLAVDADTTNNRTFVTWRDPLGFLVDEGPLPVQNPRLFAFRQRANLFGHNAVDPNALNVESTSLFSSGQLTPTNFDSFGPIAFQWAHYTLNTTIDLDAVYAKVTSGGWVLLFQDFSHNPEFFFTPPNSVSNQFNSYLFQVSEASTATRSDFGLSAKITRVTPDAPISSSTDQINWDTISLSAFNLQQAVAHVQSDELQPAPQPILFPLYGSVADFQSAVPDLSPGQVLALTGQNPKVEILLRGVQLFPADGSAPVTVDPGELLSLTAVPNYAARASFDGGATSTAQAFLPIPQENLIAAIADPVNQAGGNLFAANAAVLDNLFSQGADVIFQVELPVTDPNGIQGTLVLQVPNQVVLAAPDPKKDPILTEIAFISGLPGSVQRQGDHTVLALSAPLKNVYDRPSLSFNANVVAATNGSTVSEIMGNGSASTPNQSFTLKQSPVTYVSAPTPSGGVSTLQVRVNGFLWNEVPSLFGDSPTARDYKTVVNDDGTTTVVFGDGVEGSRLPTGQNNIVAAFRMGLGAAGNVGAGTITNLTDRPLGVNSVNNPEAATGGQDSQAIEDARTNVPLVTLTLDRAVSLTDYADFARSFAGIAKAEAVFVPNGPSRGVLVTVAGVDGAVVDPDSSTFTNLLQALRNSGDPFIPLRLRSYRSALFELEMDVLVEADADPAVVFPAVGAALQQAFGFNSRTFGQPVSEDQVEATAQGVEGVEAVNVRRLERSDDTTGTAVSFRLSAAADEILTLDAANLVLGVLS